MKKHVLLTLLISLFAVSAWAADVTVKETFSRVSGVSTGTTAEGLDRTGDLCTWKATYVRYAGSNDKITISGTATSAWWLPKANSSTYGKIETTDLEGGIKAVSFYWAQFAGNEGGNTLKLKVKAGTIEHNPAVERDGSLGGNKTAPGDPYTHTFNCKTNGQLEISNVSTWDTKAGDCRILVGPVTITPYLLYRQKDVTIGLRQQGYYNDELINNTGSKTIEYISSNENIATIDGNGVITPKAVGTITITAKYSWSATEFVTTTYTLHVEDGVFVENFSKVKQISQANADTLWKGDLFDWKGKYVRRGADDTLGLNPRIQATAMRYNADGAYLYTTNTIEGGVKHVYFDWRQWASANAPLNMSVYYSTDKDNWGDAVYTETEEAATASTPYQFDYNIDNGAKGNAYLRIMYTSGGAHAVMGAIKITPWLLYLTKEATMNTSNGWTYTNSDLMNNTGAIPAYSISPANADVVINANGQVIVTENAEVNGDFKVTAQWKEVSTSYMLHIQSRINTTASFESDKKYANVGGSVSNTFITNRPGVPSYTSSNEEVAMVAEDGSITLKGGLGETTITASFEETSSYTAVEASYKIYVRDNDARKEAFTDITTENTVDNKKELDWNGLFAWKGWQVRRYTGSDTIWNTTTLGTWIRMNTIPGYLKTADVIEGGIKYLSFYWKQWGAETGKTLRLAVYSGETQVESMERKADSYGAGDARHEKYLFGAKNVMTSNSQLTIRNESYIDANHNEVLDEGELATSNGRMIIDTVFITPYLLYTTKADTIIVGESYTNNDIINNTGGDDITYSLEDNDDEASINAESGEVTGIKAGEVTVKATWNEGGAYTWYTLTILDKADAGLAFTNSVVKVRSNAPAVSNPFSKQTTADVTFSSSNPSVAAVDENSGFVTINGEGTAVISAHSDANAAYKEGEVSYTLHIMPTNWSMETFSELSKMCIVAPEATSCATEPVTDELDNNVEWTYWLGGGNTAIFGDNAMYLRARKSGETCDYGYLKSEAIAGGLSSLSFQWNQGGNESAISNYNIIVKVNGEEVGSITAGGKNVKYDTPQEFSVTGLQYSGEVVIEIINETAYDGTDNRGRFVIDNIEWIGYTAPVITLSEGSDNSTVLSENDGKKVDVTITRSALVGGVWNTLCLPFAISKASDLDDAEVKEMTGVAMVGEVLEIYFSDITGDGLVAGKPYLVKPSADKDISGTYLNKIITSTASYVVNGNITMQGLFSPLAVTANDYNTLFVGTPDGAGNNLFYPQSDGMLRGLRAYFKIGGSALSAPRRARYVINQKDVETGIESVQNSDVRIQKIIRDGQLFIIRGGRTYSVDGQLVK